MADLAAAAPYTNPVILYGSVVVNPNTDGAIPNAALANPLGLPMEILEIRFRLVPQSDGDTASPLITGLGLGVKMDLGKASVVDAYVPVGDLGTVRDSYDNQWNLYANPDADDRIVTFPATYGWRLKYPLFVPASSALSCVVRPLGQNQFPTKVDVAYIARTWDVRRPIPQSVKVPWVSSYESKTFVYETGAPAGIDQSPNLDIINPFDVPLEVARFGGRLARLQTAALGLGGQDYEGALFEEPTLYRDQLGTVRIRSSRGFDIVRTPTAFGGLFPYNWRAWDLVEKWSMAPREAYNVFLNVAANPDEVLSGSQAQMQYSIGVTGYRDVPTSALVG